jgi:hypothetical protein
VLRAGIQAYRGNDGQALVGRLGGSSQKGKAMAAEGANGKPPAAGRAGAGRDLIWVIVLWGRVVVGLALAAIAGVAFGHAWTTRYAPWWWVGGITLLTGLLLILSAIYARTHPHDVPRPQVVPAEAPPEDHAPLVPLLGALLVYKYQFISQEQLNRALEEQRKRHRGQRRLGEILVDSGLLTPAQLREVLDYQRSVSATKGQGPRPSDASR